MLRAASSKASNPVLVAGLTIRGRWSDDAKVATMTIEGRRSDDRVADLTTKRGRWSDDPLLLWFPRDWESLRNMQKVSSEGSKRSLV